LPVVFLVNLWSTFKVKLEYFLVM